MELAVFLGVLGIFILVVYVAMLARMVLTRVERLQGIREVVEHNTTAMKDFKGVITPLKDTLTKLVITVEESQKAMHRRLDKLEK